MPKRKKMKRKHMFAVQIERRKQRQAQDARLWLINDFYDQPYNKRRRALNEQ